LSNRGTQLNQTKRQEYKIEDRENDRQSLIALWLGHDTPATTHLYVEADLTMKEQALKRVAEPSTRRLRYQAKDRLLAFLDRL